MLDDAWDSVEFEPLPLRDTLRAFERNTRALLAAGSVSTVSKNTASQSFATGAGNLTTADVAEHWRALVDLFDRIDAALSSPGDSAVYAEMKLALVPVYGFTKDFSCLSAYA